MDMYGVIRNVYNLFWIYFTNKSSLTQPKNPSIFKIPKCLSLFSYAKEYKKVAEYNNKNVNDISNVSI